MKDKLVNIWYSRIYNKYTIHGLAYAILLLACYVYRSELIVFLNWLFIEVIGVFITQSITDPTFRSQFWMFVFGGGLVNIIRLILKKNNSDQK